MAVGRAAQSLGKAYVTPAVIREGDGLVSSAADDRAASTWMRGKDMREAAEG